MNLILLVGRRTKFISNPYHLTIQILKFIKEQCVGHGEECLSHKLSDEQYDLATEFLADLNSAADFMGIDPKFLDTNPANYGFVNRNGRDELVLFDLGGEE